MKAYLYDKRIKQLRPVEVHSPDMNKAVGGIERPWKDTDKDMVPNVFDCEPNNPNKQGIIHDVASKAGGYFKEKYREYKEDRAKKRDEKEEIRQAEMEAYKEARKSQAKRYGSIRAQVEYDAKVRELKRRSTPRKNVNPFSGGVSPLLQGMAGFSSSALAGMSPPSVQQPIQKKRIKHRKHKKNKKKRGKR